MEIDERPAKILILGEASAIHTRRWVNDFRRRGWTVRWLSFPPIPEALGAEKIPQHGLRKAVAIPLSVRRVRGIIDDFRPDIVSALFLPDYGWLGCMCNRHPLAVSAWGSDVLLSPQKSRWHRRRIEYVLRKADLLFADAEFLGERMRQMGADDRKLRIIPLGVDDVWLRPQERSDPPTNGRVAVITNRRLEPLYRVDTFIRAAARLEHECPGQFSFTVVGDGSVRQDLEKLAVQEGLERIVEFAGTVPEEQMINLLRRSDLFVSCSSSDGTSVSLLEAMAVGCVPIVTDLPGNREWIEHEVNGLTFPVGDAERLAQAILQAANKRSWWKEVRQRNRQIIVDRALWENNMSAVEEAMVQTITAFNR